MINPVSNNAAAYQSEYQPKPATTQPQATPSSSVPVDTVSIGAKGHAVAASGDVDHDGDSH